MDVEKGSVETIGGIDCRMIVIGGEPYVCVSDTYHQLEIDPRTARGIISRNEDQFADYIIKINGTDLQNVNVNPSFNFELGFQKGTMYNFMNETGYNLFIQKVDPELVNDPIKREVVKSRQRGMAETFTKYRRKEVIDAKTVAPTVHPSMRSPEQVCKDKIDLGNFLADIFGIPKQMAATVSINEAQRETGVDFSNYQKLLPAVDGTYEEPKIGAQDLGKPYGDNGRKVNLLLQKLGYIYKDNGKWQMTQIGKDYGGAWFTFTAPNGHTDTHLRWPTKIKEVIKEHANFFK